MARVRVKICGIRRVEDLRAAVEEGADAVGMVVGFPLSPRNLNLSEAVEVRRRVPVFVDAVLVLRADSPEGFRELVEELEPDAIQLYGQLHLAEARDLAPGCRLIKPVKAGTDPNNFDPSQADAVLLDSHSENLPGGTGKTHDWGAARRFREQISLPLILAGGLNPSNVFEAVKIVQPYAVDVSSGVESAPGVKNRELIRAFIRAALGEG
ncbi:N-(5'-phosphoribosyl)anthranilate isomerase [Candidatus Calditenuaceae archaeon HR02]|nr:N-(5'-phosphoribosyl)anthranilate isomerase [Candidatus Calditenuaceae archaeon HR02]